MISKKKTIEEILQEWQSIPEMQDRVEYVHTIPAKPAKLVDFPSELHPSLIKALHKRGIDQLYSHQKEAFEYAIKGESFTAVTPTASGKSLCYHLPVLQAILENRASRALYLFPTKALAQDQKK